jgi:hypothetical protein
MDSHCTDIMHSLVSLQHPQYNVDEPIGETLVAKHRLFPPSLTFILFCMRKGGPFLCEWQGGGTNKANNGPFCRSVDEKSTRSPEVSGASPVEWDLVMESLPPASLARDPNRRWILHLSLTSRCKMLDLSIQYTPCVQIFASCALLVIDNGDSLRYNSAMECMKVMCTLSTNQATRKRDFS